MIAVMTLTHADTPAVAAGVYDVASYPGDNYAWGNCTWWADMRRSQIGEPVPNTWGNAATWAARAQADGYIVDHTPTYGAIMQISDVDNGLGHVAFVESVNPTDGSWTISEMNVKGLDVVDYKTLTAADATGYNFIHTAG
jgi:surface antigen